MNMLEKIRSLREGSLSEEKKYKKGQHIKIKKQYLDDPKENDLDYIVIEDKGDRLLIKATKTNLSISPQNNIKKNMVESVVLEKIRSLREGLLSPGKYETKNNLYSGTTKSGDESITVRIEELKKLALKDILAGGNNDGQVELKDIVLDLGEYKGNGLIEIKNKSYFKIKNDSKKNKLPMNFVGGTELKKYINKLR